ncbi:cell division protein FtsZ [Candidatus Micrarchaeota archaeon]|nr:cell division protein FtsZ [Candidatus Micrarchaeota archaeon]
MDLLDHVAKSEDKYGNPKIVVAGVGGAGCNTINRLAKSGVRGAELIAINTDQKHLGVVTESARRVLIGQSITKGLGAGGYPEIAAKSAESSRQELERILSETNLLFLAVGMGGGTGTGASPVVAEIAKQQGAIVVAMVTYPFLLERARLKKADEGLEKLRKFADTIVIIDNNRLVEFVPNLPIEQAFTVADEITSRAVRGITETITTPSLINLDYADVRAIMQGGGISMIAVGEGKGVNRAKDVVYNTLNHRLLDVDFSGATGVLLHLTGGSDMTLGEANDVGEMITQSVDPNANVIWGARMSEESAGKLEAIAIFTGIKSPYVIGRKSETRKKDNIIEGV